MNSSDREQIAQWVEQQLDDSITREEFDKLQRLLLDQPEARQLYLDLMQQNAQLQLERFHLSATGVGSVTSSHESPRTPTHSKRLAMLTAVVVALAASLLLMVWRGLSSDDSRAPAPVIAQIIESSDAEWGDCTLPTAIGSDLVSGRLKIERGLATIRFASGADVTLESPAELEIQSPLRGELLSGTAVIEVPESAHGFTLSTPTAIAIDHGTAFSVTIDPFSKSSSIEVIEGEVEVQHVGSDASRRLERKQRVVASKNELRESDQTIREVELSGGSQSKTVSPGLRRITTADGRGHDASVIRGQEGELMKSSRAELVLIKNAYDDFAQFSRKGYFAFDLGSVNSDTITLAKFVLTLRPSGLGFASNVGDCEFAVFGVTDESSDGWSEERLNWNSAPASSDDAAGVDQSRASELGRFVIPRGKQYGQVSIEGAELVKFLRADTNHIVTLIVVRITKENSPGGLVHGFANGTNSVAAPPALLIKADAS